MTVAVVTGAGRGMGRSCVEKLRGLTEHLVAVDLVAPEIEGTIGLACDVSDPAAIATLVERVDALGPFRALAHVAGISPTMADSRRIFDVDLVATQRLLDAFEPLVVPGSAAVCFSSLAAYQIAPFADPALDSRDRRAPGRRLPRPHLGAWSPTADTPMGWPNGVSCGPRRVPPCAGARGAGG